MLWFRLLLFNSVLQREMLLGMLHDSVLPRIGMLRRMLFLLQSPALREALLLLVSLEGDDR